LLHRALQRVLVLAREVDHLLDLRARDLARIRPAHPHSFAVNLKHHLRGFFPAHAEHSLEHDDDKVHRRVVVVQQDDLVKRRRLGARPLRLEHAAVLLLVGHRALRKPNWGSCLTIATHFSRGNPMDGSPPRRRLLAQRRWGVPSVRPPRPGMRSPRNIYTRGGWGRVWY